jgi:hypothetical protein
VLRKINITNYINSIIRLRFLIALVIFLIVVSFKLHGSSINMWDNFVGVKIDNSETSLIWGKPRAVRGDEWRVQTPYYFAQATNDEFYPLYNDNIRSDGENMIIAYNAPVMDITVLSKPFNWGFLLLGKEYGLSWYWAMKTILLFLLSFEISMILTKKNNSISLLGALWITLSPAVQWWFMQHVGDLVFYFEAIVVSFYYMLYHFNKLKLKILFSVMFALSAVGFVLVVYPPIQVPLVYLGLVFMFLIFTDFKANIKIKKVDIAIILCTLLFIALNLGYFVLVSKDALKLVLNTVYPGKRISTGGEVEFSFLQIFITNVFMSYKNINFLNQCEVSSFYNFLPAVLISMPLLFKKKVANLKYGSAFAICNLLQILWMLVKFPTAFAKITLLSYVTGPRMMIAFGLTALYLSIWGLGVISELKPFNRIFSVIISIVISSLYILTAVHYDIRGNVGLAVLILILGAFLFLNYLFLLGRKTLFAFFMSLIIIVSGVYVNPLVKGTGAIYNKVLSSEILAIKEKAKDAVWASFDDDMGSYLYAHGVKTVNGIHFYPDLKAWNAIDPEGKYSDIYNRYAHVSLTLSDDTKFELQAPDHILVYLTEDNIKKLNIKYVLSKTNFLDKEVFNTEIFKEIYAGEDGFSIYEIQNN